MSYPPPTGSDPYGQQPDPYAQQPNPYAPPAAGSDPYAQQPPPYVSPIAPGSPAAPDYGQPYAQPYGVTPPPTGNNGLSLASMITGITSMVMSCCCWPIGIIVAIAAMVLGVLGLKQVKERGQSGRGMAIAGIATGGVGLIIAVTMLAIGASGLLTDPSFLSDLQSY